MMSHTTWATLTNHKTADYFSYSIFNQKDKIRVVFKERQFTLGKKLYRSLNLTGMLSDF